MKTNKEKIYDFLKLHAATQESGGVTTQYLAEALGIIRTNVSSQLNELVEEDRVTKSSSRPVLYKIKAQEEINEDQCFENLVGVNGSLRRPIQIAKAAIIYPEKSLNTLIIGAPGTGKTFLAMIMHRYAIAAGVIPEDSPFIVFDCKDHQNDEAKLMAELFGETGDGGCFAETGQGVLHIDNAQLLSTCMRNKFCSIVEEYQHHDGEPLTKISPIVIVACDSSNKAACDDYAKNLPIVIELPSLADRPMEERLALIQSFFTLEAARAKRTMTISAELLRCLLLYDCVLNIKQLKGDIKRACALAYFREHDSTDECLEVFMSDFEPYVRKGFLNYQDHREEIEQIIPADYSYAFSEFAMEMSAIDRAKLKSSNMYAEVDRRADALLERGMTNEEVGILLTAEYEAFFRQYWKEVSQHVVNKEQLANLVDARTINLVETFVNDVSEKLRVIFPPSVFYGLCLHVDSIAKGKSSHQILTKRQMSEIVEKHQTKYALALQFATEIEKAFSITLPVEEAFIITLFLCFEDPTAETTAKPVILIALLGDNVATSIAGTVNQIVKQNNTFSFEVPFEHQPAETYKSLYDYVKKIDQGKGIVALYDMEFLCAFFETIEAETGIEIRTVQLPMSMVGIECARKAAVADNVDNLYQSIVNSLQQYGKPMDRVIVTLCTTGEGGAQELKKYIEKHGDIRDMKVIPLSIADFEQLRENLRMLQEQAIVYCIVGTNDPKLFSIPFIPISDVLGVDPSELPEVLRFKNRDKSRINFDEVFTYLGEQLEHVEIKKLRKMLPQIIDQINDEITHMSLDTEVGLLMHIACYLNRVNGKEPIPQNLHKDQILENNDACYKKLLKILKPLERSFEILFTNDEMANIIMIIKKL
ncbi:MAG: PRD domain-containing protein [Anaerolineaceae bacterium]|jgi:transcriptional regulatory protein LevR/transcriptional regulator with AAA-type ATPase domain